MGQENINGASRKLKRKFADARYHKTIIEKKFKNKTFNNEEFVGNISLIEIEEVKENCYVDIERRCILSNGYKFLEIYKDNENYCITSIFNDNKKLVEIYIDVSKKLGIEDGVPYEDDLYLDVVLVPDGRKHLLDEDELEEAFENNIINKEEYDLAYRVANKMYNLNEEEVQKMINFSYKYLDILLED